jgi:transposase
MMGERRIGQEALFYEFSLERHVPERHLLRSIDRFVELDGLRRELAPFYSEVGRPSIDPELMIRMLIVGYCFGIRSERRLCEEVHLNLAYRWFCRLGLDGEVPDHSTFSKNRHGRFRESDLLRRLFETVLQRCIDEGLVGGEGFAVDASLIRADASGHTRIESAAGLPPDAASRAVEEYLAVLDDAAFGAATEVTPKFVAPADPAARWTARRRGPAFFAYSTNYLIDVDNAIIVDVEATTTIRQAEVLAAKRMIERSLEHFDLYPERLIGDTAYGSAEMLDWLVDDRGIEPHIPVFDKSQRSDGTRDLAHWCMGAAARLESTCLAVALAGAVAHRVILHHAGPQDRKLPTIVLEGVSSGAPVGVAGVVVGSTKVRVTWLARSPRPSPTRPRAASAKRSRCYSHTSSAF